MPQGRAPRVLDVGVGTGMLSAICLLHGAAHVVAVDVNSTMAKIADANLRELEGGSRQRFAVVVVPKGKQVHKEVLAAGPYDMVVSEILGTLTTSENMLKFLSVYAQTIRTFADTARGGEKVC